MPTPKKILIVTKDLAEFLIYQPIVEWFRSHTDYEIRVVAEGLSLERWLAHNEPVIMEKVAHSNGGFLSSISPEKVMSKFQPNLVLAGLGMPNNLGNLFGLVANELGIKLGYVTDVWGAESRSKAIPYFVCVLDAYGEKKVKEWSPFRDKEPRVYITGSPAMDRLRYVTEPTGVLHAVTSMGDETVVLFVGQDESTTPALEGLVTALNEGNQPYVLVPRFHPKFRDAGLLARWHDILATATGHVLYAPPSIGIQQIMKVAMCTVSVYSNALIEAASLGSLPVSWVSDIGREKMSEALGGIRRFPLVDNGCAIEVRSVEGFIDVLNLTSTKYAEMTRHCQKVYRCDGKNTERVATAIRAEIE